MVAPRAIITTKRRRLVVTMLQLMNVDVDSGGTHEAGRQVPIEHTPTGLAAFFVAPRVRGVTGTFMIPVPSSILAPGERFMQRSSLLLPLTLALAVLGPALLGAQAISQTMAAGGPLAGYGASVAVGDGALFVGEVGTIMRPGAVYVYHKLAGEWSEAARIEASDGAPGDGFGSTLAIDQSRMLVGAVRDGIGTVYSFERTESGFWREGGRLLPGDAASPQGFGASLAIRDGFAVVGAPRRTSGGGRSGADTEEAVFVFEIDDAGWSAGERLLAREGAGEDAGAFGTSVAIDGDRILVGAPREGGSGAVHEFRRTDNRWEHAGYLVAATLDPDDAFGASVRLGDGRAVVGAPGRDGARGAVFVFTFDQEAGAWSQVEELSPAQGASSDAFGGALAAADDHIWVGAPRADDQRGVAYVYSVSPGTERDGRRISPERLSGDAFAASVHVHGSVALLGMTGADYGMGRAVVYELLDQNWMMVQTIMGNVEQFGAVRGGQIDCSDGTASAWDCSEYDLVAYMPVQDLGGPRGVRMNDIWGWTDPMTGREYALAGRRDGTSFIDVSDPANPRYVGQLFRTEGSPPSTHRDIKVYADHAFIVADGAGQHGVQVFDLTQLRNVTEPITFEETAHYDGIASAHNIVINEESGFAYSVGNKAGGETCGGGLHIIDIREPTNPTFAGCFADPLTGRSSTGTTHDAQCVSYRGPDEEHIGKEICLSSNQTALSIADVTDPANPVALSRASYPNLGFTHQGWLTDDQRYFYTNDELDEIAGLPKTRTLIWDVADLDDPQLVKEHFGTQAGSDHNLYIRGDLMYQSNYRSGLRVLDISDRENPVEVGYFDTVPYGDNSPGMGFGSWSNYPFFESGIVILTSNYEGLFILKKKQPIT